jgi:hypothetical protein
MDLAKLIMGSYFLGLILAVIVERVKNVMINYGSVTPGSKPAASSSMSRSPSSMFTKKCYVSIAGSRAKSASISAATPSGTVPMPPSPLICSLFNLESWSLFIAYSLPESGP